MENARLLGLMLGLICGVIMAFLAVSSRILKEIPTPVILFYHTFGGIVLTAAYIGLEAAFTNCGFRLF